MMHRSILLALAASALATPYPQGVTAIIAPSAAAPAQCNVNYDGKFGVAVITDIPFQPVQTAPAGWKRDAAPVPFLAYRAANPQESTVTVRSTRYHTRTVIVESANPAPTPASAPGAATDAAPAAAPAADEPVLDPSSAPTKAFIISQLETGQVQIGEATDLTAPSAAMGNLRMVSDGPNGRLEGCAKPNSLQISLNNGVLKDARGWTGYIADNRQFQFDNPPQHGALYTAGFSVCNNGTLALGGSSVWWQCRSGNFYNLYDKWIAPQCSPVHINVIHLNQC